jgi:hypothetical protein
MLVLHPQATDGPDLVQDAHTIKKGQAGRLGPRNPEVGEIRVGGEIRGLVSPRDRE